MGKLTPDINKQVQDGRGGIMSVDPDGFLTKFPRVASTCTITIGGTITNADVLHVEFQYINGTKKRLDITVAGADTTSTLAAKLANAINADADLKAAGVKASVAAAVVTVSHDGPISLNSTLQSWARTGGVTVQVGGTATASDRLYVRVTNSKLTGSPLSVFSTVAGGESASTRATALRDAINANAALAALGIIATVSTDTVTIATPATLGGETTFAAWPWAAVMQTATIAGTITTSEVVSVTITGAGISGGAATASYTIQGGDTTATHVATGLAAAINAKSEFVAAGITATPAAAVVSIAVPAAVGPVTFTRGQGANTTNTLGGGPTSTTTKGAEPTETAVETAMSGGSGPVIPTRAFKFMYGSSLLSFQKGEPRIVTTDLLKALLSASSPIT